jgi:hypothetical protein
LEEDPLDWNHPLLRDAGGPIVAPDFSYVSRIPSIGLVLC